MAQNSHGLSGNELSLPGLELAPSLPRDGVVVMLGVGDTHCALSPWLLRWGRSLVRLIQLIVCFLPLRSPFPRTHCIKEGLLNAEGLRPGLKCTSGGAVDAPWRGWAFGPVVKVTTSHIQV